MVAQYRSYRSLCVECGFVFRGFKATLPLEGYSGIDSIANHVHSNLYVGPPAWRSSTVAILVLPGSKNYKETVLTAAGNTCRFKHVYDYL